jgi:hypothetical protein
VHKIISITSQQREKIIAVFLFQLRSCCSGYCWIHLFILVEVSGGGLQRDLQLSENWLHGDRSLSGHCSHQKLAHIIYTTLSRHAPSSMSVHAARAPAATPAASDTCLQLFQNRNPRTQPCSAPDLHHNNHSNYYNLLNRSTAGQHGVDRAAVAAAARHHAFVITVIANQITLTLAVRSPSTRSSQPLYSQLAVQPDLRCFGALRRCRLHIQPHGHLYLSVAVAARCSCARWFNTFQI